MQNIGLNKVNWAVVEQPCKVENGEKFLSTEELHFFETVEQAAKHQSTDILISSGVLPYVGLELEPLLELICLSKFKYVIIDRNILVEEGHNRIAVQKYSYAGESRSCPFRLFNRRAFYQALEKEFTVLIEFVSDLDGPCIPLQDPEDKGLMRGFLLERKS